MKLDSQQKQQLWASHRLRPNDFFAMLENQDGRCAICREPLDVTQPRGFHVDHDHAKKKGDVGYARGVLCKMCNPGLGCFRDDPRNLRAAAAYLEQKSK